MHLVGNSVAYQMDCMDGLRQTPDKFYELCICDPPYGIGEDGRNNHTRGKLSKSKDYRGGVKYDNQSPDKSFFDELRRVSKKQIIWGANHFISKIPYDSSAWIIWDKMNGETDFADCELAWTSFDSAARKFEFKWQGMLQGNMKDKEARLHPNQKPVALYKWLLTNYAKPGDHILDTHGGSGSSMIACYDLGFDMDWIELDPDYFKSAKERFERHKAQGQLFHTPEPLPTQQKMF